MPDRPPLRVRVNVAMTRAYTSLLRRLRLRGLILRVRESRARLKRQVFEKAGSPRYSRPGLHEMDRKLDEILNQDRGFYVEAGGADGYTQSNTYYLERFRDWRGVLVEPMPELAAAAHRNRPQATVVRCALVAPGHPSGCVEMEFGDLFTTVRGVHASDGNWTRGGLILGWRDYRVEQVPAKTLSTVLDEASATRIDLLSLDVEGYEAEVLSGLDLERHAPHWVLVEMHDLERGRAKIGAVLGERYVEHEQLSPMDVLYKRIR
jgi:FkbM family methyltransferase